MPEATAFFYFLFEKCGLASDAFVDELDDVLGGGSGQEDFSDA
jgi:hypothetical protein